MNQVSLLRLILLWFFYWLICLFGLEWLQMTCPGKCSMKLVMTWGNFKFSSSYAIHFGFGSLLETLYIHVSFSRVQSTFQTYTIILPTGKCQQILIFGRNLVRDNIQQVIPSYKIFPVETCVKWWKVCFIDCALWFGVYLGFWLKRG